MTAAERLSLDAEIHRRVFGRECRQHKRPNGELIFDMPHRDRESHELVPGYSRSMAAAWAVVEWLKARTPHQDFHLEHLEDSGWSVGTCGREEWITAPTAPEAICRAALAALEARDG